MAVWLLKPAADDRDGALTIRSRVGLSAPADAVAAGDDLLERFAARPRPDVIVVDECQFLTEAQIDQLRAIVDLQNIPVLCFGLRTDLPASSPAAAASSSWPTPSPRSRPSAPAAPRPRSTPASDPTVR